MEGLFGNNIILLFFFSIMVVFSYNGLEEYQQIAILYITIYVMAFFHLFSPNVTYLFVLITLVCYMELLTKDFIKFRMVVNPFWKLIDCLYRSFMQYDLFFVLIILLLNDTRINILSGKCMILGKMVSLVLFSIVISRVLEQKYIVVSFEKMYKIFRRYPINQVRFNQKLKDACDILVGIEDITYWKRKSYTFLSIDAVKCIWNEKTKYVDKKMKIKTIIRMGEKFIGSAISKNRGYSTIPMQLIRSIGIERGYDGYKYRRKIFEIFYSYMFFNGLKNVLKEDTVGNREHYKSYLLYIYFHVVNTYFGDIRFSKFLNAFDMQGSSSNKIDIYDVSNEGIFVACMGLSKRASKINEENIDYYLSKINNVELDREKILDLVLHFKERRFDRNYLQ